MDFDLKIVFTGLCLFVPEETSGSRKMHVLLPSSENHEAHGIGRHHAYLHYDRGYTAPDGEPGVTMIRRKLKDEALVVRRTVSEAETSLPPQIVSLYEATNQGHVPAEQVKKKPKLVRGRVTLESGSITDCAPGAFWHLGASWSA